MKRLGLIVVLLLLALAFALWPEDEAPAPAPSVEPIARPTTTPASPPPSESPLEEAPDEVADEDEVDEPALPEVLTLEVVRHEPCDADESPCQVPVAGVPVELRLPEDGGVVTRATSAADGTIPLPNLPPGTYDAYVVDPALFSQPITIDFTGEPQFFVLEVSRLARFDLRVVSPSGAPIPGAEVELVVDGQVVDEGKTNEGGHFHVERSSVGRVELLVRAPGYAELHDAFLVDGDVSKTVSLQRGRTVTVHVQRAANGPNLMVNLSGGGDDWKGITIGPRITEARFTDMPARPLLLMVSESINVGTGPILTRQVGPAEDDVTVTLEGAPLVAHVEGPRPKSGFARGVCCAAHYVELRCEGFALRRKMLQVPGEVTFPFVPPAPCWVSYDGGPEKRASPPAVTLHTD